MKKYNINKDWQKYKAVIFDVDGTLYNLSKMHRYIFWEMLKYYIVRPCKYLEIFIVYNYRKERERLAHSSANNIAERQYDNVAKKLKLDKSKVIQVIDFWMNKKPLEYIEKCLNIEIKELIDQLRLMGVLIVYFSDYDPTEKVKRLDLKYDYFFCSCDREIDALKPSTKGLSYILEKLRLNANQCLLVGDRDDKEGLMAREIGMDYNILG